MNITDKMVITAGDVLMGHVNAPEQAIYKAARHALNAALAVSPEVDAALLGVGDTIEESGGWWKACSGCYDTEDGHPTMKYGHSAALKTEVGLGCHECGGLGAVWEYYSEADLAAMQQDFLALPEHPDDRAVDRFAEAMKEKLAKKRAEGRGGWQDKDQCSREFLSSLLREHVEKGDPLDIMNFAMMLHQRGETVAPASAAELSAIDALQAIANLPTGKNLDVMTGHEDAYRAIEKLFPSPPYIAAHEERVDTVLDVILSNTDPLPAEDEENVRQFDAIVAKASAAVRSKRGASELTDDELLAEMAEVEAKIANGFGERSGSPGEWYYERADEVRRQIDKRIEARLTITIDT